MRATTLPLLRTAVLWTVSEPNIMDFFPLENPRAKQVVALEFLQRAVDKGFRDIVLAAPTGAGKTLCGAAACFWGHKFNAPGFTGTPGGYYLITQLLLQDQLEREIPRFSPGLNNGSVLKSAGEYECPTFQTCAIGGAPRKNKKLCALGENCAYKTARARFLSAQLAVTNYAYFLTERTHVGKFPKRRVIVFDECHSTEKSLLRFYDLIVAEATLSEWAPTLAGIPPLKTLAEYTEWVQSAYLHVVTTRAEAMHDLAEDGDTRMAKEAFKLDQHVSKIKRALELIKDNPRDWIFWESEDSLGLKEYIARPLNAAPFMPALSDMGDIRLYMSAFPGEKHIFCRSLGLDPDRVAWCGLASTFPVKNRPVVIGSVGSMSRRNLEGTLPIFMSTLLKIFKKHEREKGLSHCQSSALGKTIVEGLKNTPHFSRVIFPQNADEREGAFKTHCESPSPTVIITPSMTEGFDFYGDLARWSVIAKCPYPSLSDRQIVAKKDQDPDWYCLEAIKGIIQAAGRVVRSDDDRAVVYILDSDFERLYERYTSFFPKWFTSAFVYPRSSS